MNKLLVRLLGSLVVFLLGVNPTEALPPENVQRQEAEPAKINFTPLGERLFGQPTARHLGNGQVLINLDSRSFFFPNLVEGGVDDDDSAVNFNTGFSWGISDNLQLTLQFQHVDSSSPVKQGAFISERTEDNEAALELKQQLWSNSLNNQALSGVVAASWGTRGFMFSEGEATTEINNRDVFVSFAAPYTAQIGDRWQFNISPTVAFFKDKSAVFFHRLPNDEDSSFGTVVGVGGGITYKISSQLFILGDVFFPLTGNNSINRGSGQPDRAIAYNAGLRYLTTAQLALDLYVTNTFASFAPLSLTADRGFMGIGANLVFMPDLVGANRLSGDSGNPQKAESITTDGLAFFDGGTLPSGKLAVQLQGGSQGILTAVRYGLLKEFEGGIFLDYVSGEVDESEQGISGKIRLLNQAENAPITVSVAGTASLTNEPFVNFLFNDTATFERRGLDKTIPVFTPGGDDNFRGKRVILTLALPVQYKVNQNTSVWFTPILGYAQRLGTEIAGFNLGSAIALGKEVSFVGEVGANFVGEGNSLIDGRRENRLPWTVGVRWQPLSLLDKKAFKDRSDPYLELYFTNRVGFSTWHQLRVRENNDLSVGVGLFLPFSW